MCDKMLEEDGKEVFVKRYFTAIIRCSSQIELQIDSEMEAELNLFRVEGDYFAYTVEFEPERLRIKNPDNIYNEIQENIPDEVLEKVDTYISALSLALGFGFILEALYVSGIQILDENGKPIKGKRFGCINIKFRKPYDIGDRHKNKFNEYFNLLSKIDERYTGQILRAVKWWTRGSVETDKLDKFIDFYVVLEILGEIFFSNDGFTQRVKKICEKYNLNCKFKSKHVTNIRGALFHSGQYEELAREISDDFGNEVLKAILYAIHELSSRNGEFNS